MNSYLIPNGLSNFLNLIRWFAALLVVLTHLRTMLFTDYNSLEYHNIYIKVFYFITSLGGEAVMVFFVLSGYLVGGKVYHDFKNNTFSWKNYFLKRISRLYIVLVPALLMGVLLDYLGMTYFNSSNIYNNALHLIPFNYDVSNRISLVTFLSNLLMFQTTFTTQLGSNGPLWSLANEFWYYIMFPFLLNIKFSNNIKIKLLSVIVLCILVLVLNIEIVLYFSIWLLGVLTYIYSGRILSFRYAIFIFILGFYINTINILPYSKLESGLLGITISLLLISLSKNSSFVIFSKLNNTLADSSYSLYLFHDPFLLFLCAAFSLPLAQQLSLNGIYTFVILLISIYIYSFIMYYLFERNTYILRSKLLKKFA